MTTIAGIDLGTTFSALAVLNEIGKPEIIPNADGDRLTPSAIFFDEEDAQLVRVGIEAINSRYLNVDRSVRWVKRHMGDKDFSKKIDGKNWSAVDLSSLILKKLKQECSIDNNKIKKAVISVPAHFDEIRRKATMDAGKKAGLDVIAIINEPVAAALYYATTTKVSGKVLVYDLGGGTFDVTIMDVNGQKMDILCSQGDHALGGVDFDKKVLEIMEDLYRKEHKTELIKDDQDRAKYEDEAEDIKKTLSRREVAKKMLYGKDGNMRIEITRQMLEDAIIPLINRSEILIEVALDEIKLKPKDIDKVLLVGGSSRIPLVKKRLAEIFGFEPETAVNLDECVAMGAAIHAGLTEIESDPNSVSAGISAGLKDIALTDVCNHSYGTICAPLDKESGRRVVQNHIILKKNTPLPCEETKRFYTMAAGQTEIEFTVTQGEDNQPEFVNVIATHKFELPPDRPAKCPIDVTYKYDTNQRMQCKFHDLGSGKTLEIEFCLDKDGTISESDKCPDSKQLELVKVQ
jgi:molecular chaperone DnaK